MKSFVQRILLFLSLLIVLSAGLSWFCNAVVMQQSIVLRKDRQYSEFCDDIRYLFLGDSHVLMGVNPDRIPHSFNFGMGTENIVQTYYKLRYFLEHPRCENKPRVVILPFDQHSFSSQRMTEWAYDFYYFRFAGPIEAGRAANSRFEYLFRYLKSKIWSYQDQGSAMLEWLTGSLHTRSEERVMIRGYTPRFDNFASLSDSARADVGCRRARFLVDTGNYELYSPVAIECFEKLIDLCERNQIEVVLLSYPVTREYSECAERRYGADPDLPALNEVLERHPGLRRLDFRTAYWDRPELFGDSDHLNEEGANVFSAQLSESLNGLPE